MKDIPAGIDIPLQNTVEYKGVTYFVMGINDSDDCWLVTKENPLYSVEPQQIYAIPKLPGSF